MLLAMAASWFSDLDDVDSIQKKSSVARMRVESQANSKLLSVIWRVLRTPSLLTLNVGRVLEIHPSKISNLEKSFRVLRDITLNFNLISVSDRDL